MLDLLAVEQFAKQPVFVAGAVVGEHAANSDAKARVMGPGHEEEGHCRVMRLIGQYGGEGDAGVVVDCDVQILVSSAS